MRTSALLAVQDDGWRMAEPGWQYCFPRDHGPHREYKTEWWYATGNLVDDADDPKNKEGGYGFQLTFFRQGIRPGNKPESGSRFRVTELPFAHFTFTDVHEKSFKFLQKSSRGAFGEAGFTKPPGRIAWIDDWLLAVDESGRFHLRASGEGRAVDLVLTTDREPLTHGENGISPKSATPGHASHYYSMTRLQASGTVSINGVMHPVHGLVWFDHEWASNSLAHDEAGWDWSGLHLSNGEDLMVFRIRDAAKREVFRSGTLREANGTTHDIKDMELTPVGTWKSPHTGGLYSASWHLRIPSRRLELTIVPKLADQELVLPPFAYWEGAIKGNGSNQDQPIQAEGYFEMTGYGGKIMGLSQ